MGGLLVLISSLILLSKFNINISGDDTFAYINTFWLKIIQRKWRKVYNERKRILQIRKSFHTLRKREMTGKWPKEAYIWPKFKLDLKI